MAMNILDEIENMKGNIFDKIRKASNKYIEYMIACDDVAKEAQKYIDWDDNVSCEYYPADGRGYKGNYDSNRERRSKTCLPQYLRKRC